LLDHQENPEMLDFKDHQDHQECKAKEVSWDCLVIRDHKVQEDIEESQESLDQREPKVVVCLGLQEYLVQLDHRGHKVKVALVQREHKDHQGQEDILAFEARWVLLGPLGHANSVLQL